MQKEFEKFVREVRTIDVSTHQGVIDWDAVKASGKVDAVILRLGYGVGYIDSKFIRNKNELERLGIPYSVYLFSYAESKNESLMESNFLVNTLNSTNAKIASNIFSLYYDLEDDAWCCVRPSGTEPKVKFYMGVKGKSLEDADAKLDLLKKSMMELSE